jgi:hypothetical protein
MADKKSLVEEALLQMKNLEDEAKKLKLEFI